MRKWKCVYCSHVYDEALGDADSGTPPGTLFDSLPDDWMCPECGAPKSDYHPVDA